MLTDHSGRIAALGLLAAMGCATAPQPPAPTPALPSMEHLATALLVAEDRLPLAFARTITPRLVLLEHSNATFSSAFYVPLPPPEERQEGAVVPPRNPTATEEGNPAPRVPEGIQIPPRAEGLLFVNSAAYATNADNSLATGWKSLAELPVDSTEYLFHALLQAYLELEILPGQGPFAEQLERRAAQRMAAIPPAERLAAYVEALSSFGAHTLAVANELERLAQRQSARGGDICQNLERPGTLFALWPRIFTDGQYTGRYYRPGSAEGAVGKWVETGITLDREDKALFLHHILEDWWGEDPATGMQRRYCPDGKALRSEVPGHDPDPPSHRP